MAADDITTLLRFVGDSGGADRAINSLVTALQRASKESSGAFAGLSKTANDAVRSIRPLAVETDKVRKSTTEGASSALAFARAQATLQKAQGDVAAAANTLRSAIAAEGRESTATVRAQAQLTSIESQLATAAGKAEAALLREAQAMARLQVSQGNVAAGTRTLAEALASVDRSTINAIRAQTQLENITRRASNSSRQAVFIVRESIETLSSELLENFLRIDGDIANTFGTMISRLNASTLAIGGLVAGFAVAAVAIPAALFAIANSTAKIGEELLNLSKETDVSIEALSALRVIAEDSGVSLDTLGNGLGNLNENLLKARDGNKELATLFRKLGVDIKGTADDALEQIIKKFAGYKDGLRKTQLAQDLFGSAGKDVLKVIRETDGDLPKTIEKIRKLGLVMNKEGAEGAKRFTDQTKELGNQLEGLKISIGSIVIPAFTGYLKILNEVFKITKDLLTGTQELGDSLRKAAFLGILLSRPDQIATLSGVLGGGGTGLKPKRTDRTLPGTKPAKVEEAPNLEDGKKKPKGSGAALRRDARAEVKILQDLERQAELANRRITEQLRDALDDRLINLQGYTTEAISLDKSLLRARLASINEQEQAALKTARSKAEKDRVRADFDLARDQALLDAELAIEEKRNALRRTIEDAEEEHREKLVQIREIGRKALSDQIEAQIREGIRQAEVGASGLDRILEAQRVKLVDPIGLVEGRKKQRALELKSFDERARLLQDELNKQAAFSHEIKRINDEIAKNAAERAAALAASARKEAEDQEEASRRVIKAILDRIRQRDEEIKAEEARRQQGLAEDPSSPLSIFGPAGQEAADRGAGLLGQLGAVAEESLKRVGDSMLNVQGIFDNAFSSIGSGLGSIIESFILTGQVGPQAFKKLAAGVIAGVVAQAAVKAIFELAEGLANQAKFAATLNPQFQVAAGLNFAAAKTYGLIAGVGAAAALTLGAFSGGGGSEDKEGQEQGAPGQKGDRVIKQGGPLPGRGEQQPIIVQPIINLHGELRQGVLEIVHDDINNNGRTRDIIRREANS